MFLYCIIAASEGRELVSIGINLKFYDAFTSCLASIHQCYFLSQCHIEVRFQNTPVTRYSAWIPFLPLPLKINVYSSFKISDTKQCVYMRRLRLTLGTGLPHLLPILLLWQFPTERGAPWVTYAASQWVPRGSLLLFYTVLGIQWVSLCPDHFFPCPECCRSELRS